MAEVQALYQLPGCADQYGFLGYYSTGQGRFQEPGAAPASRCRAFFPGLACIIRLKMPLLNMEVQYGHNRKIRKHMNHPGIVKAPAFVIHIVKDQPANGQAGYR